MALTLAACSSSDDDGHSDSVVMPVTLTIPASDDPVTTRVGDPGTYEHFELPRYAYVYIICPTPEGTDQVVRATWSLDATKWTKTVYNGQLSTSGDSIYQYTGDLHVYLPINRGATGRVYAALSVVPLSGLPLSSDGNSSTETEADVLNYQYELNEQTRASLGNVYSTPYNYRPDGTTYYGMMTDLNSLTPHLDLVLYHVAAKLDMSWNVSSATATSAITKMELELPDAEKSYIFRPLETVPTTTYKQSVTINTGNQWYGRSSFYIVPMTGSGSAAATYSFSATATTADGTSHSSTAYVGTINKEQPFLPWMRGTMTVRSEE